MALPPDILAALQGGGGAMPPQGGPPMGGPQDIPPEILAALGGGGGMPMEEELPPEGALHGGSAAEGDPEDHYRTALDHLEMGMKADVDEARINVIMQCATKIQGELANSQKGMDGMLGGKMDPAMMRRMSAPDQAF